MCSTGCNASGGAGHAPAADAAALLGNAARQLRAEGQLHGLVTDTATVRSGVNHATDDDPPTAVSSDIVDVPVRTAPAGYELAAQGFDSAAQTVRAGQADERHLTGLAEAQQRNAAAAQGLADIPGTEADEHGDGLAASQLRRAGAQHDQAAADQQRRLARAFPPLRVINPVFSHAPAPTVSQPATTRRKGSTR
jgi:hypothetical protein